MRNFPTGATRDSDDGKLDYEGFLNPRVIRRYAEYMHEHRRMPDGSVRASDNWQRGIPIGQYMKSLWRHFHDVWSTYREGGLPDEEALCAVMFNTMGMLLETMKAKYADGELSPCSGI